MSEIYEYFGIIKIISVTFDKYIFNISIYI